MAAEGPALAQHLRMVLMGRTITVHGCRIRAIEAGPADGDPVLCVHGLGGWAENWRETLRALGDAGFRAVAIDLPGFGQSEVPSRVSYFRGEGALYARLVPGVLDALGIRHAHVLGHSLGGAVAYMGTVSAPDRVRSLTLVAPGGLGLDLPWPLRLGSVPFVRRLIRRGSQRAARAGLASCFREPRRIPPTMLEECDRYARSSVPETLRVLQAGVTLRGLRRDIQSEWLSRAGRYRGPVLVVWGEDDIVLPISHARAAAELFPRAVLERIGDAGHLVMVEQPEAFHRVLLPYLLAQRAEAVRSNE